MNSLDYGTRQNGKKHGVVLTKPIVVEAILDMVGYHSDRNLDGIRIVEPSAGEGAFALEILRRLHRSSILHQFDFGRAIANVHFYEIDASSIQVLQSRIEELFSELGYKGLFPNLYQEDYLRSTLRDLDVVVGNPPYVRYDNIPEATREVYKSMYATFRFRSDLYIAFYEKCLSQLKVSGKLGFVCANRWLKSQYGKPLRQLISHQYQLETVIDLTGIQAFEEEVLAYPAITILSSPCLHSQCDWYNLAQLSTLNEIRMHNRKPDTTLNILAGSDEWFGAEFTGDNEIICTLEAIEAQGFKIGIGVATGCDKIFVGHHLKEKVEDELLLPIISGKDLRGDKFAWRGEYLLNPYDTTGRLIHLDHFPMAKKYLEANEEQLRRRHISKKNPNAWYRTIDKVQTDLTRQPKILLPDISGNRMVFIDKGGYYPHHNIYYITGGSLEDLKVLSALLMSDFVRNQLDSVGNKMNGGYPRWQSQNLRKLRIPRIKSISPKHRAALVLSYEAQDYAAINAAVRGILASGVDNLETEGQLVLF